MPLKVGILEDVLAHAASIGLSERDARNGVKLWCRGHHYWSRLIAGSARVDLQGTAVGVVSADEAEYGKGQEKCGLSADASKSRGMVATRSFDDFYQTKPNLLL
jgi:ProP effector